MGIYTDLANTGRQVPSTSPKTAALDRSTAEQMLSKAYEHDPTVNSAVYGARPAMQALYELNVVSGSIPALNDAPADWVVPATNGSTKPRTNAIKDLALEADVENVTVPADGIYDAIVALYPQVAKV